MFDLNSIGLGMGIMFAILLIGVTIWSIWDFIKSVEKLEHKTEYFQRKFEYQDEYIQKILARLGKLEEEIKND